MRKLEEVIAMAGGVKKFREITGFSTSRISVWRTNDYIPKKAKEIIEKNFPLINEKFWIDRGVVMTVDSIFEFIHSYKDDSLLTIVQLSNGEYKVIY